MADPTKHLVFSILKFFEEQASSGSLSEDAKESLEVALQCIEAVYETYRHEEAVSRLFPLPEGGLPAVFQAGMGQLVQQKPCISDSEKEAADAQKNAGNELMKAEKYSDALTCYNKAISIDGQNAVYYCNRAAAHSKLSDHKKSLEDCVAALSIDPNYGKAYGRKGLAYMSLNQWEDACMAYKKATELDPANESYKNCLEQAEIKAREGRAGAEASAFQAGMNMGNMDLGGLFNNPALMNMATQMMSNPAMQNMMANMMGGMAGSAGSAAGAGSGTEGTPAAPQGMEGMMQIGQQLADQMRNANPELVEQLRNQMGRPNQDPPPGTS